MKKLLLILAMLVFALTYLPSRVTAAPTVKVSPKSIEVNVGETCVFNVLVELSSGTIQEVVIDVTGFPSGSVLEASIINQRDRKYEAQVDMKIDQPGTYTLTFKIDVTYKDGKTTVTKTVTETVVVKVIKKEVEVL